MVKVLSMDDMISYIDHSIEQKTIITKKTNSAKLQDARPTRKKNQFCLYEIAMNYLKM